VTALDYDELTLAVIGVLALGPAIPREIAARLGSEEAVIRALAKLVRDKRAVRLRDDDDSWTDRYALIVR
jgi:hypothetical protein